MLQPLTKDQLDQAVAGGCQVPGCKHDKHKTLFLKPRCHKNGPVEVSYTLHSGVVRVSCRVCKQLIVDVAVEGILGATGEAPTSDTPGDQGALCAALSIQAGRIRFDFGKNLSWLTMTPEEAVLLAAELVRKAKRLQGVN